MLSNMTELSQTNRMRAIALMFEATLECYQCGTKSDKHQQLKMSSIIRKCI